MDFAGHRVGAISCWFLLLLLAVSTPLMLHADTLGFFYSDGIFTTFQGAGGYTEGTAIDNQGRACRLLEERRI